MVCKLGVFVLILNLLMLSSVYGKDFSFETAYRLISADSLRHHVEYLGSDLLNGRGTGTPGGELAARYIASKLGNLNLKPIGDDGSYFQKIPMHSSKPLPESELKLVLNGNTFIYELGKDYLLYKTGAQTFIPKPVSLVFVGYGIIAPEFDYNDYQILDVEDKIVVFLSGEPPSDDPNYFNGVDPTIYSSPESKQRIAISRGARGSIMIPAPQDLACKSWSCWQNEFAFEDVTLPYSVTGNLSIVMNPATACQLFTDAKYNLHQVFEMDMNHTLQSFALNGQVSFKGEFVERDFFASNVLALLQGANQKSVDSYIIISAHYDHLGVGPPLAGDSIYNGVFDNAIGVAALLEIARVFKEFPAQPLHSIIFLLTTGEEKGLLGARYYLDHPYAPLYRTIANVNIDGVALFDTFNDVIGIGAEFSTLGEHLQNVADALNLEVTPLPSQFLAMESFARSDQIEFAKAGIPAILMAEGLNYNNLNQQESIQRIIQWQKTIYHTPFDDLSQPLNFAAAQQHCHFLWCFCFSLANCLELPQWKAGTPYINARLQTLAEKR